jgi:dihydrofolate reductase
MAHWAAEAHYSCFGVKDHYTGSSLVGFIVDDQNSLDWLTSRNIDADGPFGYRTFIESVGALVMGATTYEWIVAHEPGDWMYTQPTWVLTHRPQIVAPGHHVPTFRGEVTELYPQLLQAAGYRDVWVVGGGEVAAQFVSAGLVDELILTYAPCTLGNGGRVLPVHSEWSLVESGVNGDFLCARWRKA